MPRALNDVLPVDRYLAISAECVACDCGAGEAPDEDEMDVLAVADLGLATRTRTPSEFVATEPTGN